MNSENDKSCWTCDYIEKFAWICCNADSEYRGDVGPLTNKFKCKHHKAKEANNGN